MKAATCRLSISDYADTISIHAAREGGDPNNAFKRQAVFISIHAAREGGDRRVYANNTYKYQFQSTPPVKAATLYLRYILNCEVFQSTPPVKAATIGNCPVIRRENISIHAAREGGD